MRMMSNRGQQLVLSSTACRSHRQTVHRGNNVKKIFELPCDTEARAKMPLANKAVYAKQGTQLVAIAHDKRKLP